jgi:phage-related protein
MIHVIRQKLVDTTAVTNLVPASRISLVNARQGMERPYIAIDLEETRFERNTTSVHGEIYNVLVYITDESISSAWAIHSAVKQALSEFTGTITQAGVQYDIGQISLMDVMTDAHELHDFYVVAMSFNIFVSG